MRWLVKTEPDSYSFADLVAEGATEWTGVRNPAAAKHLRSMTAGDPVLIYHSGKAKAAVGTATVSRTSQPDPAPTQAGGDDRWVSVQLTAGTALARPVTLATMRASPALADLPILKQPRLSVSPVTDDEWTAILNLASSSPG